MPNGPRAVKPEEFESLLALVNRVFKMDSPGGPTMRDGYPHLFALDNLQNLRVIAEDGRIVSHVGTTLRNAVISGCHVRVGNVGAVSTDPDYRGRGYAGLCFDDACANARAHGVDFMLISGDRKLYRRAGCRRVGLDREVTLTRDQTELLRTPINVEEYRNEHLPAVRRIYQAEPVRYLRPLEEWQRFLKDGRSTQHSSRLRVISREGTILAYAALYPAREDGTTAVEEYAGDRMAIAGALDSLLAKSGLTALTLHVQGYDKALLALLGKSPRKVSGKSDKYVKEVPASGTQLIVHFEQFMARLRPLMEERVGTAEAARVTFREYNGRFVFAYDGETMVAADRGGAGQFIWGAREPLEWEWAGRGPGREVLEAIFPIPALVYGFSYV